MPSEKASRVKSHPYLSGNFAPIQRTVPLSPCTYTGSIPISLAGGQYVRNGSNPIANSELGRAAHWFDGDGMLSGVLFRRTKSTAYVDGNPDEAESIQPEFINQYIQTDVFLSAVTTPSKRPILPSIAVLVNPASTLVTVVIHILRTVVLVILSFLPGSRQAIRRISVANTSVVYHDGRALATCESGPPMRIQLPELTTVGWYNNGVAEGEPNVAEGAAQAMEAGSLAFMKEWTTSHPKVDPMTDELILFHAMLLPPYVQYSVVSADSSQSASPHVRRGLKKTLVPGVSSSKMMHDFGVSASHTIILDLPLSLDPFNMVKGKPVVSFDAEQPSRFGVFPRYRPTEVRWFEGPACCIFHTANAWDEHDEQGNVIAVNLLACHLQSASLVFAAGNIAIPKPNPREQRSPPHRSPVSYTEEDEEKSLLLSTISNDSADETDDQCCLHHFRFFLGDSKENRITHSRALSSIPFEFPAIRLSRSTRFTRFVYGCSTRETSFGAALGKAAKIDVLVKMDVATLLSRQSTDPGESNRPLDTRSMADILASRDENDAIKAFAMPAGWVAQEMSFVPSSQEDGDQVAEDDGHLLFYAFDESQLDRGTGEAPDTAVSELWVFDAKTMKHIVARVSLPQRVPYGLHGRWFDEREIMSQRAVKSIRGLKDQGSCGSRQWLDKVRERILKFLG